MKWINCDRKMPKDDSYDDFPNVYVVQGFNDGGRGTPLATFQCTAQEMPELVKVFDWARWLDESK